MSFCRPLLSSAHILKFPYRQIATSYTYTANAAKAGIKISRGNVRHSKNIQDQGTSTSPPVLAPPLYLPSSSTLISIHKREADANILVTANTYEELRNRDRNLVANLPPASYHHVLTQAFASNSSKLANWVVLDILEVYQGGIQNQDEMLRAIMTRDVTLLSHNVILQVLQHLQESRIGLDFLQAESVARLARMISESSSTRDTDQPLLRLIHPIILRFIKHYRAPGGIQSITFHPPRITCAAFAVVHKLLLVSCQQEALDIFQTLVKSRQIPPEAIQGVDSSSNDFSTIIAIALVRASLHWNWRSLAAFILIDLLESVPVPDQAIIELNIDTIYALLDTPNHRDIRTCGSLIRRVHKHTPVSDSVIRQFYNSAAEKRATAEAETLYAFTRSPSVLKAHRYPPPQGIALSWLMAHLTSVSRKTQLSRILATEVVDNNLPIPLQTRARFIAMTAAQGYAQLARQLWERHTVGKDGGVVLGNSALLIRMASLFANLSKRVDARYRRQKLDKSNGVYIDPEDEEALRTQSKDLTAFLDRILLAFKTHHEPLPDAPHWVLTSFARACFIIGRFTEGFDTFQLLLNRKELPDLFDINVALSAIAQIKPRLAFRMIGRMIENGLRPDAVTFGTVMHHALLQRDQDLVNDMTRRLHDLGDQHLTVKSLAGLIRAIVAPSNNEPKEKQKSKLNDALRIIQSFPGTNIASSSQTGKYLVYTSLRVEDPVLAYKFWKLCLKDSTEWKDREQRFLRRLITQMIEKYHHQLDNDQRLDMLSQLGQH